MAIRLENKQIKRMASYLEDDQILELLEESNDEDGAKKNRSSRRMTTEQSII